MHLDYYELVWFKLAMMIGNTKIYILILVRVTFPWFKVTGTQESRNFCVNYLTKFSIDFMESDISLRRVGLTNLLLSLSWHFQLIWGREGGGGGGGREGKGSEACFQTWKEWFLSNLGWIPMNLPVWKTWTFSQGDSCMRNENLLGSLSQISKSVLRKLMTLPWPSDFISNFYIIFAQIKFRGENLT